MNIESTDEYRKLEERIARQVAPFSFDPCNIRQQREIATMTLALLDKAGGVEFASRQALQLEASRIAKRRIAAAALSPA